MVEQSTHPSPHTKSISSKARIDSMARLMLLRNVLGLIFPYNAWCPDIPLPLRMLCKATPVLADEFHILSDNSCSSQTASSDQKVRQRSSTSDDQSESDLPHWGFRMTNTSLSTHASPRRRTRASGIGLRISMPDVRRIAAHIGNRRQ